MSDTPGPWRRIDGEHYQRCGAYGAHAWRRARGIYRWRVYAPVLDPFQPNDPLDGGAAPTLAPTLAAAKRAATAALIRHAPMPF